MAHVMTHLFGSWNPGCLGFAYRYWLCRSSIWPGFSGFLFLLIAFALSSPLLHLGLLVVLILLIAVALWQSQFDPGFLACLFLLIACALSISPLHLRNSWLSGFAIDVGFMSVVIWPRIFWLSCPAYRLRHWAYSPYTKELLVVLVLPIAVGFMSVVNLPQDFLVFLFLLIALRPWAYSPLHLGTLVVGLLIAVCLVAVCNLT